MTMKALNKTFLMPSATNIYTHTYSDAHTQLLHTSVLAHSDVYCSILNVQIL